MAFSDSAPQSKTPITGGTQLAAVIGDPVRHSLSPVLHNAAFEATGSDWVYVAFPVTQDDLGAAIAGMRALDIRGLSVTMPHKETIIDHLDRLDPVAEALNAVNCVAWDGEELVGFNTDGVGFLAGFERDFETTVSGKRCAVVGAGGAARAVIHALGAADASEVVVINRTQKAAERAVELAGAVGIIGEAHDIRTVDVVINATSVGMAPDVAATPVPTDVLQPDQIVADLIYHPFETALMTAARARGCRVANGLSMLIGQAGVAFEYWTKIPAPITAMELAAKEHLSSTT